MYQILAKTNPISLHFCFSAVLVTQCCFMAQIIQLAYANKVD